MTEVFHFLLYEMSLRRLEGDFCLPEKGKHLVKVLSVFLRETRKKNHIIYIYLAYLPLFDTHDHIHGALERRWGIVQPKGKAYTLPRARVARESRELLVLLGYWFLPVTRITVQGGEHPDDP